MIIVVMWDSQAIYAEHARDGLRANRSVVVITMTSYSTV